MHQPDDQLTDLIDQLETTVKQARKAGGITPLLTLAASAMDQLEHAANNPHTTPAGRQRAQNAARKLGYNAAADAWPFWDNPPPDRTSQDLNAARAIAKRVAALTNALPPIPKQLGNAAWLIGAFDLALGDRPSAQTHFQSARAHFETAPEMKLMAEGYLALAGDPTVPALETTIQALLASTLPDTDGLAEQLVTARQAMEAAALF